MGARIPKRQIDRFPLKRQPIAQKRELRQNVSVIADLPASPHGPTKVLVKTGMVLDAPEIVQSNESQWMATKLRQEASGSERRVAEAFRQMGFDHSVPKIGFYLDFYHPALKIAIEIDGPHHAGRKAKDRQRDAALRAHGIRTWRFKSSWAFYNPEGLAEYVRGRLTRLVPSVEAYLQG